MGFCSTTVKHLLGKQKVARSHPKLFTLSCFNLTLSVRLSLKLAIYLQADIAYSIYKTHNLCENEPFDGLDCFETAIKLKVN